METPLTNIRDQQRQSWNTFSQGWKKWDTSTMNFLQPMGDAIISFLQIHENDVVLDIASGTGEPGLTIAGLAPHGRVTGFDIAENMLKTAKEKAGELNISNFAVQQGDACEMPFQNNMFDKISCRMGFMFFPDMQMAANEMFRVLKPGGRMATSVWFNPSKNFWIGSIMSVINKNIPSIPPPAGAPGMFRCAQPGLMKSILQNAGFGNVEEKEVAGESHYNDFADFWTQMNEIAAPVVGALNKADEVTKTTVKQELHQLVMPYITTDGISLPFSALVVGVSKNE